MSEQDRKLSPSFLDGIEESYLSDSQLLDWTARIRSGERGPEIDGIARRIIMDFHLRTMLGAAQSNIALSWVASALAAICEFADPLESLGLMPRPKGRPLSNDTSWEIACWVAVVTRRGYQRAEAIHQAAEMFHTDPSNVRRHLREHANFTLDWPSLDSDFWEQRFLHLGRPLPPIRASN